MKDLMARAMRRCDICDLLFLPQKANARTCSADCARQRRECRSERVHACPVRYGACAVCGKPFVIRPTARGLRKTCGGDCAAIHRDRLAAARKRNREHARRTTLSDITTQQEMEMRRRARRCAMCGVSLTSKAGLPNSKHLDHIVPLGAGGTHTHGNVRITCRTCNLRRPKDGSDFAGPVTLWAVIPGVAPRPDRRQPVTVRPRSSVSAPA